MMFATNTEIQRAAEPMMAAGQPRAFTRRIDCCERRAQAVERPARGGAPPQAGAWEHTRFSHT